MAKIYFTLTGCANGHPVRIEGSGTATATALRFAFKAVETPFTFDVHLALFAGLDAALALVTGLAVASDSPLVARVRADIVGEGAIVVGTIAAVVTVERRRGGYRCTAQLAEATGAFEVGERITSIGPRTITAVPMGSSAALLSAATMETSRGRELAVLTNAALAGADVGPRRSLIALPPKLGGASIVFRLSGPSGRSRSTPGA